MPFVGIDAAEHDIVLEHRGGGGIRRGELGHFAAVSDPGQADHPAGGDDLQRLGDDRSDPGAFHDDVGLKPDIGHVPGW